MKAPNKIYLQVCGECPEEDCKNCKFEDLEDNVTWCKDRIYKKDKQYIRKDALLELAKRDGIPLGGRLEDCGTLVFDREQQDVHAGEGHAVEQEHLKDAERGLENVPQNTGGAGVAEGHGGAPFK